VRNGCFELKPGQASEVARANDGLLVKAGDAIKLLRSRRTMLSATDANRGLAADSGVVLCVARGIVRIATGIIRAAARLSGGIDRLIGVTARKCERRDREDDAEPPERSQLSVILLFLTGELDIRSSGGLRQGNWISDSHGWSPQTLSRK
jgi:hypothetical protein